MAGLNFDPGHLSAAWLIANAVGGIDEDNRAQPGVHILVTMGKDAGFLAASSVLAKRSDNEGPHKVFVPEKVFELKQLYEAVEEAITKFGRAIIVVSEGIRVYNTKNELVPLSSLLTATIAAKHMRRHRGERSKVTLGGTKGTDGFGGLTLSGTSLLGDYLQKMVEANLPKIGRVRAGTFGFEQRAFPFIVDLDRQGATAVARSAVKYALGGMTGSVALLPYDGGRLKTTLVPLEVAGSSKRSMPAEFLSEDGCGINQGAYLHYALPLIGEHNLMKKAELLPIFFTLKKD
jgi:6-phosphofructokinase 1